MVWYFLGFDWHALSSVSDSRVEKSLKNKRKTFYKYCFVGKACELIDRGDNTYGGKWVINPSGGLISKGHPLGATGMQNRFI